MRGRRFPVKGGVWLAIRRTRAMLWSQGKRPEKVAPVCDRRRVTSQTRICRLAATSLEAGHRPALLSDAGKDAGATRRTNFSRSRVKAALVVEIASCRLSLSDQYRGTFA